MLAEKYENYRDEKWRREEVLQIKTVAETERFINEVGFCFGLTDARTEMPSIYIAVCGRRDAYTPRNVQKDYETSLAWTLKDDVLRRGKVYYGKVAKAKSLFIAPRLIPHFNSLFGVPKNMEDKFLSLNSKKILQVLRTEWEMASADLRQEAGISDRKEFNKALDELQAKMIVIPNEVIYEPKFTYIWTLAEARFVKEMSEKLSREDALFGIVQAFLVSSGAVSTKTLAKLIGLTLLEINLGCLLLAENGLAEMISPTSYVLKNL
jgi:hypothetical protein